MSFQRRELNLGCVATVLHPVKQLGKLRKRTNRIQPRVAKHSRIAKESSGNDALKAVEGGFDSIQVSKVPREIVEPFRVTEIR